MGTKNNPGKYDCYANAKPDEPIFVLRGSDTTAALMVTIWVAVKTEMAKNGASKVTPEKLDEARTCSVAMAKWAKAQGKSMDQALVALAKVFEDFSVKPLQLDDDDAAGPASCPVGGGE